MFWRQLDDGPCKTYLIASEKTREAALVDPLLRNVEAYLELLAREGLRLKLLIDSHTHADHLSGCIALRDRAGAPYLMHARAPAACVTRRVEDGESVGFGDVRIQFLHTPGHTADSLTLLLPDRVLSGDFLFIGSFGAGRLDLPGSEPAVHYESLRKIDGMPDDLLLFPAHDYEGQLQSTLGAERAVNPVLRPQSRDAYLRWWRERRFGPSDWMIEVLKANAACTRDPKAVAVPEQQAAHACAAMCSTAPDDPALPKVSSQELALQLRMTPGSLFLLDVRTAEEYAGELGHIEGSVLIPVDELEARWTEVHAGAAVISICRSGKRAARAAAILRERGVLNVRVLAGGMLAWAEAKLPVI